MTKKTLLDACGSIQRFLLEARQCANQGLGFAAMSTIFPVILAVSEAINPALDGATSLIRAFVPNMADKTSWLIAPVKGLSDDDIAEKLAQVRNSIAHELSLPDDMYMTNTYAEARSLSQEHPDKYFISTVEFVNVIQLTVSRLLLAYPHVAFDPDPRTQRSPADRVILSSRTSGSAPT